MSFEFTELKIEGLHGRKTITVPIRDNKIVMVGVNGLGKTTVINLLYYALSRQWDRMLDYNFHAISVTINGVAYYLEKKVGQTNKGDRKRIRKTLEKFMPREELNVFLQMHPDFIHRAQTSGGIFSDVLDLASQFSIPADFLWETIQAAEPIKRTFDDDERQAAERAISDALQGNQILYLPTYRRIERDLKFLFPEIQSRAQTLHRRRMWQVAREPRWFVEFVEFGMEDVGELFEYAKQVLNTKSRSALNNLAGGYLRDVIQGQGADYDPKLFANLSESTILKVLDRVEEKTLDDSDKSRLKEVIKQLPALTKEVVNQENRYIAHFFSKLVAVHEELVQEEQAVSKFIKVCNRYLVDKSVHFDTKNYLISIRLHDSNQEINLASLSSGEKQIVSLFAHLYLFRHKEYVLLIDEPELSLSVAWQKLLLPDIWEAGRCVLLAAVTHSPFVFDNVLEGNAVDLATCIQGGEKQ